MHSHPYKSINTFFDSRQQFYVFSVADRISSIHLDRTFKEIVEAFSYTYRAYKIHLISDLPIVLKINFFGGLGI